MKFYIIVMMVYSESTHMLISTIIWVLSILDQVAAAANNYSCSYDQCLCCRTNEKWPSFEHITDTARLLVYTSVNDSIDITTTATTINYLCTNLKEIQTPTAVMFRFCSSRNVFDVHAMHEYMPVNQEPFSPLTINGDDFSELDHCLFAHCNHNNESVSYNFRCANNDIRSLNNGYVNRSCFSRMKYVYIESENLITLGHNGWLTDNHTTWNIIHLTIDFANDLQIQISCNAFQFLTKLRSLRINVWQVRNFKCFFRSNPDLVKIVWNSFRVWNTCNDTIDIWVEDRHFSEDDFYDTFFDDNDDDVPVRKYIFIGFSVIVILGFACVIRFKLKEITEQISHRLSLTRHMFRGHFYYETYV